MNDVNALWDELFPAAKVELLRLLIQKVEVFEDKIRLLLHIDGLKQLMEEMSVSGFFRDEHEAAEPQEQPDIRQSINPDGTITLEMPIVAKKLENHCNIVIPNHGETTPRQTAIIRAIRRAQRWEEMFDSGEVGSVEELAEKLGFKSAYVSRILSLGGLAPDIVSAILSGSEPEGLSLERLVKGFPDDWEEQRLAFGFVSPQ